MPDVVDTMRIDKNVAPDASAPATKSAPPTIRSEPPVGGGGSLTRVTVNLAPRAMAALERISARSATTKTDVINRGLLTLELIMKIAEEDGGGVTIKRGDGKESTIYFL